MKNIVLINHSGLAVGTKDNVEIIIGKQENFYAF